MLKKLKKTKLSKKDSGKSRSRRKTLDHTIVIGGPTLVSDFSARQLTSISPARAVSKIDLVELVSHNNLDELKKHRLSLEEVNQRNENGQTALHKACSDPELDYLLIEYLVSVGASVNASDNEGLTPLHNACKCLPDGDAAKYLAEHGADANTRTNDGTKPLHYYVRKTPTEGMMPSITKGLDALVKAGADINETNVHGETPLHIATMQGNYAMVELLLQRGADPNKVTKLGDTPLHYAILSKRLDVIRLLVRKGVDPAVTPANAMNGSPLELASKDTTRKGREMIFFLNNPEQEVMPPDGYDVNGLLKPEVTSLIEQGNWEYFRKLKYTDEELKAKNKSGQCLLHVACNQPEPRREFVEYLLGLPYIDINGTDNESATALHLACRKSGNLEIIKFLLSKGADVSRTANEGMTPLMYFARHMLVTGDTKDGYVRVLDEIAGAGANINAVNTRGETALHNAVIQGNLLMLQALIAKNADVTLKNSYGDSILDYAVVGQKREIIEALFDAGMDPRVGSSPNGTPLQAAKMARGNKAKEIYEVVKRKATALDIAGMTEDEKREYKRNRVIEELVETEKEYLHDLEVIIRIFLDPLREANRTSEEPILTATQIGNIFGNVEEIKQVGEIMYREFQACAQAKDQMFGKIFLEQMHEIEKYEKVCVHQQTVTDSLFEALNAPPSNSSGETRTKSNLVSFRTFCEAAQKSKECKQLSLDSFLIKPFQRITKYPLLLRELAQYTLETHPDFANINLAREKLNQIINQANEKKRVLDNIRQIRKINNSLVYGEVPSEVLDLTQKEDRQYLKEGKFPMSFNREKLSKRYIFLFNDIMVFASTEKKKYLYLHSIPAASCIVWDVADGTVEGGKAVKHSFSLIHRSKQLRVVICFGSEPEKASWLNLVNECIGAANTPFDNKFREKFTTASNSPGTFRPRSTATGLSINLPGASEGLIAEERRSIINDISPRPPIMSEPDLSRPKPPTEGERSRSSRMLSSSGHSLSPLHSSGSGTRGLARATSVFNLEENARTESVAQENDFMTTSVDDSTAMIPRRSSSPAVALPLPLIAPPDASKSDRRTVQSARAASERTNDGHGKAKEAKDAENNTNNGETPSDIAKRAEAKLPVPINANACQSDNHTNHNTEDGEHSAASTPPRSSPPSRPPPPSPPPSASRPKLSQRLDAPRESAFGYLAGAQSNDLRKRQPSRLPAHILAMFDGPASAGDAQNQARIRSTPQFMTTGSHLTHTTPIQRRSPSASSTVARTRSFNSRGRYGQDPRHIDDDGAETSINGNGVGMVDSMDENTLSEERALPVMPASGAESMRALAEFAGDPAVYQLDLKVGDVIIVYEKDPAGDGWWYGECNGRAGYFPGNFAEPL